MSLARVNDSARYVDDVHGLLYTFFDTQGPFYIVFGITICMTLITLTYEWQRHDPRQRLQWWTFFASLEGQKRIPSNAECPVCLESLDDNALVLPCCHGFHRPCIERWLRVKAECPVCRWTLPPTLSVPRRVTTSPMWMV